MTKYHILAEDPNGHWEEIAIVDSSSGEGAAREGAQREGWHLAVPARSWNKVELEDDPTPRFRVKRSELPSAEDVADDDDDEGEDEDEGEQSEDAVERLEELIDEAKQHQASGEASSS